MKKLSRVALSLLLCLILPLSGASAAIMRKPADGATLAPGSAFEGASNPVLREHRIDSQWYSQTVAAQGDSRYSWSTANLEKLPVNGGKDLYARIRAEGCYAAAIAMVFRNLRLKSKQMAYDPRTGKTDYLAPDPLTITLANMGYPENDAAIMHYSRDPIYMHNSYTLASGFGASYINRDSIARDSKNKARLVADLLMGEAKESGVIVRIDNLRGGTHFFVVSGFREYADGSYDFYVCDPMDRSFAAANIILEKGAAAINYGRDITDITGLRYFKR